MKAISQKGAQKAPTRVVIRPWVPTVRSYSRKREKLLVLLGLVIRRDLFYLRHAFPECRQLWEVGCQMSRHKTLHHGVKNVVDADVGGCHPAIHEVALISQEALQVFQVVVGRFQETH